MATLPKVVTYEEWLDMPITQDAREEVLNGEIRIVPPNKAPHPDVVDSLTVAFHSQLDRKRTKFYGSTFGLVIRKEPLTCRSPDVAVFERSTMIEQDGYIHSAPQLVIEVLSASETRREISEKLRDYESIGVAEVWLVSPEAATVEILYLQEGKLRSAAVLTEGILKPKHFPSVQIDIASIWPE
jgi:Uma2 family endonuclease